MARDSIRLLRGLLLLFAMATAAAMGFEATRIPHHPYLGMTEHGAEIALIASGGPAEQAGLQSRDRLVEIDGRDVERMADPSRVLRAAGTRPIRLLLDRHGRRIEATLIPTALPAGEVAWQYAYFLTALLILAVGTVVFSQKPTRLTTVFFGTCLALSALLFHPWTPPGAWGESANRVALELCAALLPGLLLHFFLLFPYERLALARRPGILAAVYGPGVLFFFLGSFSAEQYARIGWKGELVRSAVEAVAALNVLALIVIAVALFVRTYRASPLPSVRRKLKVTLWGTLLGLCPLIFVISAHTLWPNLAVPGDRLATLMVFFLPASFGYAIVRHGVFEIEFIVKRSLVYSAMTSLFALLYFLTYLVLARLLRNVPSFGPEAGTLLVVLFVLVVMSPVRGRLQERLDRWIYPDRYDTQRALRDTALQFREARGVDELGRALIRSAETLLGAEQAGFLQPVPAGDAFLLSHSVGVRNPSVEAPTLGRLLSAPLFRERQPMLRGDLEAELPYGFLPRADLSALRRLSAQVLVPLGSATRPLGILVLGQRRFGEVYSGPDLLLLEGIAAHASVALENVLFQEESEGREAERREMEMARALQQQLLPHSLPKLSSLEIAARNLPCHEVGGDYYDLIATQNGGREPHLTLAIGDVSGKGVPAALLMANVQASFRAEAQSGRSPHELLAAINQRLCAIERPERFVSLFCAHLDPTRRRIDFANAGHPAPILLRADGACDRLERGGLLLGIRADERYEHDEATPRRVTCFCSSLTA
ncbi:MAG: SpoIIE family protein phosphatase [Candidatus Eisenbacteria bacterium]